MAQRYDLAIIGAGPAGLALAAMASAEGLQVAVVERLAETVLAAPPPDGRDIALTHRSLQILKSMGIWARFPAAEIAPIDRAAVRNATSPDLLSFTADGADEGVLGYLVGNNIIRKALYDDVRSRSSVTLVTSTAVTGVVLDDPEAHIKLGSGGEIAAPLVVAADSRFSDTRRKAGIGAEMRDFGRVCIVCRMSHEIAHDRTALEWFDSDQTLAMLPLNGGVSSIVLTLPSDAASRALARSPEDFAADVERRLKGEWGRMRLAGERHAYPLVAVYAHRFHAHRFALVGDAAVGMHPVTAHGFNFGLRGAQSLTREIVRARTAGLDIGSENVLAAYDRDHRRATQPLYMATNAIVGLYTDNSLPARIAREALLRVGNGLSPVKSFLMRKLTEIDEGRASA